MATTVTFRSVRRVIERQLPCKSCGKTLKRRFSGEATYNPFNDGDPPAQAMEDARRQADRAEENGVTCTWCADAPQREALLAFADGQPLPERRWGNATDILIDRGNIREVYDNSECPCCKRLQWKIVGHEITDKGRRLLEKTRNRAAARQGDSNGEADQ